MQKQLVFLVLTVFVVQGQFFIPDQESFDERLVPCHIPTGNASFCVDLDRCRMVDALIENLQKPIPGDVSLIIRDSFFCPQRGDDIKVCCPFEGIENPKVQERPIIRNRGNEFALKNPCLILIGCLGSRDRQ